VLSIVIMCKACLSLRIDICFETHRSCDGVTWSRGKLCIVAWWLMRLVKKRVVGVEVDSARTFHESCVQKYTFYIHTYILSTYINIHS